MLWTQLKRWCVRRAMRVWENEQSWQERSVSRRTVSVSMTTPNCWPAHALVGTLPLLVACSCLCTRLWLLLMLLLHPLRRADGRGVHGTLVDSNDVVAAMARPAKSLKCCIRGLNTARVSLTTVQQVQRRCVSGTPSIWTTPPRKLCTTPSKHSRVSALRTVFGK